MTAPTARILGLFLSAAAIFGAGSPGLAQISDTKHNLSISGPGPIKSTVEEEICVFCHTPHRARRDIPYLWNRADSTANYTTYESSTLYATVGQPTGASKLCLSCHDGTIALGAVLSRPTEVPFAGGVRFFPEGPSKLGTDLSDDHPVSFVYDENLAATNGELASPSSLTGRIRPDASGQVQCTSCHDPHDDTNGKFLLEPNNFSNLCVTCHTRRDWNISAHATSNATWPGSGPDPWPHTDFVTVAENGCENCHSPHNAGGHAGLLNYLNEEDNCLACHNSNVASTNIETELTKVYGHKVQDFTGVHDPVADLSGRSGTHVECVDCHNPHRATNFAATAPHVPGVMNGVAGVSSSGAPVPEVSFAYEVCFKCHADNNVLAISKVARQLPQLNTRLEFDITSPSYHPIESTGKNPNVPSLIQPLTINSVIYCTDCHNNDQGPAAGGNGPKGPHGSVNEFLLERNYSTADLTVENSFAYDLCYKCHDRNSILADESFSKHKKHVQDKNAPCSACHDPHGISSTQGNSINNSHLINFDINIVQPNAGGQRRFEDLGTFAGRCYLSCHGKEHAPETYP